MSAKVQPAKEVLPSCPQLLTEEERSVMMDQSALYGGEVIGAICIEGGGVKGAAYAGVVQQLEKRGKLATCKRFSGASAGSQAAAMLALGVSADVFTHEVLNTDFASLMDGKKCLCFKSSKCRDCWSLCTMWGAFQGKTLKVTLNRIFKSATGIDKLTFKQAIDHNGNHVSQPSRHPETCLRRADPPPPPLPYPSPSFVSR